MIFQKRDSVSFFQFPKLAALSDVQHAVFTRHCGYSSEPFQSLNVSFGVGDVPSNVHQNLSVVSKCMDAEDLVSANQVHGTEVLIFSENSVDGLSENLTPPFVGDALVTDISKKNLVVKVADCQSVLLYDPDRQVVANVHCGWRGSIKNIIGHTIKVMEKQFTCHSDNIVAGIGPSLGPCCAEFINYKSEIPAELWGYKEGSNHFDFWSLSRDQLCDAGVLSENIDLSEICTQCNTERFFSFRGEGTTGRFAVAIGLK